MGWLLRIYLLENIAMIVILRFLRLGAIFTKDTYGIFIGILNLDFNLTFSRHKAETFKEIGNA